MENKTIANWLIGTLATVVILSIGGVDSTLVGLFVWVMIAWIVVAIIRLYK